jgi:hypothetical protein
VFKLPEFSSYPEEWGSKHASILYTRGHISGTGKVKDIDNVKVKAMEQVRSRTLIM